jgi:DNA-binding MarR family transcriptional regulator/GNAT superfamily N-acetyltransferase
MDLLQSVGSLGLGSRLKRLSDQLMQDGILVYRDSGVDFEPRWFPVFLYLKETGPSAVMDIARGIGVTHPTISQVSKEMINAGLVAAYKDTKDKRKRVLALTMDGKAKAKGLESVWLEIGESLQEVIDEAAVDFLENIQSIEHALERKSFHKRFQERHRKPVHSIELLTFTEALTGDFQRLNEEWISEFFEMEEEDRKTLDDPAKAIIDPGGEILFARDKISHEVLGTCALLRRDDAVCELAKMAVSGAARGKGIGRLVGEEAVRIAREMGFMKLYLESNSVLSPALGLYRELGFVQMEFPYHSDYSRADVYMELML